MDTEVRRRVCLSDLCDGYRNVPSSGTSKSKCQNKSPHTLKKRKTSSSQSKDSPSVPPPTAIADLQHNGAGLRIAPEKISTEKLLAGPAKSTNSGGSDE